MLKVGYILKNIKNKGLSAKSILLYGTVFISLVIVGYYLFNPTPDENKNSVQSTNTYVVENSEEEKTTQKAESEVNQEYESDDNISSETTNQNQEKENEDTQINSDTVTPDKKTPNTETKKDDTVISNSQVKQPDTNNTNQTESNDSKQKELKPTPKVEPTATPINTAIKIIKKDITSEAKFYPYEVENTKMEIIAVKASDGTIRTALNTCQVCFDSGKGYYEQIGEFLVCQNCGNRFHIDQIEKIKGGCNPVPVLKEDKIESKDFIFISESFMTDKIDLFSNWQKDN